MVCIVCGDGHLQMPAPKVVSSSSMSNPWSSSTNVAKLMRCTLVRWELIMSSVTWEGRWGGVRRVTCLGGGGGDVWL